ncbi:MAG: FAD:protein FMN transferase, partial [Bdellovibrio sp.]|nr:FAD:protein FMN transferase [Bdellovibrio sp.]
HNPESELSKLNANPEKDLQLSPLSLVALHLARGITRTSGGLFNCTCGGHLVSEGILPRHDDHPYLEQGMAEDLYLKGFTARLQRPVLITLDGIAKGYAVDLAVKAMKKQGVTSGWVNAGGDLRVFGEVQLPLQRREVDESLTHLGSFQEIAIATSTVFEQYNPTFPGKIQGSALVPPQTGAWTVAAPSTWLADALTKVASLAPIEDKATLIAKLGGQLLTPQGME